MVRVRKNAESLTAGERDRFVNALATLNNQGAGRFADFRNMHTNVSSPQAHGAPGFLPWHRAYLLDLERELQAIDPSVALPYWRFDQPAPKLFTPDFFGSSSAAARSIQRHQPPAVLGHGRCARVTNPPRTTGIRHTQPGPTVNHRGCHAGARTAYARSADGRQPARHAHTRWNGFLRSIGTAAKDPLFFLLHCNVDRLWAKCETEWTVRPRSRRRLPAIRQSHRPNLTTPCGRGTGSPEGASADRSRRGEAASPVVSAPVPSRA